jgi:hypothetical protein
MVFKMACRLLKEVPTDQKGSAVSDFQRTVTVFNFLLKKEGTEKNGTEH